MKETADAAAALSPSVEHLLVVRRMGNDVPWTAGRDVWWHETVPGATRKLPDAATESEDPYMLIYTSGTTGKPKGAVHVHCGFPIKGAQDMAHLFDVQPDDTLFWLTDIGWMMGPWAISGTLMLGATLVIYEGTPDFPAPDRLWDIAERHGVTIMGIAPTVIRSLMTHGDEPVRKHDLSKLRVLGASGEPWNSAALALGLRGDRERALPDHQLLRRYRDLRRHRRLHYHHADQALLVRRASAGHGRRRGGRSRPSHAQPGRRAGHSPALAGNDSRLLERSRALRGDVLAATSGPLGARRFCRDRSATASGISWVAPTIRSRWPASASAQPRSSRRRLRTRPCRRRRPSACRIR